MILEVLLREQRAVQDLTMIATSDPFQMEQSSPRAARSAPRGSIPTSPYDRRCMLIRRDATLTGLCIRELD